ncbi:MFS transporter [Mucilaginibacter sp. SP1R1]|uniref:MFS transporter n=1 Tax=Mucilaginibacter sp. SP1R1 TaxID=2723091 RepID=UPI001613351A|nr:MFS transporter [Mucilaginibacter sp. SP1R1]MBB6152620.1 putative MFS family arabinose efflux permease [Mucilaginibacter sp. SP1R1]
MTNIIPVFKSWVPEWLIRFALLIVVLPGVVLFALSVSNVSAAAGYYGITPNDVQYSLIILYGSMASFIVLEGRFFKNIASKEYLLIGVIILIGTCYLCYVTHSFFVLLMLRYVQGMLTCGTISITLTLMFNRLHGERSREIGYSVVYCILLCVVPFTTLITSSIIDTFNYNVIYKFAIYSYIPGALIMFFIMNNVRLNRKLPLYRLDWPSWIIYSAGLCFIGYVLIYGQQYDWLGDRRIALSIVAIVVLLTIFLIRQWNLKRPYLYLKVFRQPKFVLGAVLLFVFYIVRGSFGVTTSYLGSVLGMDPIHISYMLIYNIAGIIVSVIISSRLVLLKKPTRLIFIYGFVILLIFHVRMCFIFGTQADSSDLIIPLILQGLGAGMLMVPIILFIISSSPAKYGNTGSAVGIFVRFLGFCSSIALINFFQLYGQTNHYNRFQEQLSSLNPLVVQKLTTTSQALMSRGVAADQAVKISNGLLNKSISVQAQLRFAIDYYQLISWLLLGTILLIALFPSINRTTIGVKTNQPAPVAF